MTEVSVSCATDAAGAMARSTRVASPIGQAMVEWAATERKISRETLGKLDVGCDTIWFPDADKKLPAIKFKYPGGWKARAFPEKHFVSNKGFELSLWNLDRVLAARPNRVFITEGELDAIALVEAGVPPTEVLSVPNGATKAKSADVGDAARSYGFVDDALKAGLNKVARIIWVGDDDEAGLSLRSDMARIFGAAKFCFVNWPEGVKDANDMLRTDGPRDLLDRVVNGHMPWPVAGLYKLSELPEPPPLTPWTIGFDEWRDEKGNDLLLLAPGLLSVVTGFPGCGKTIAWTQIWYQTLKANGLAMCDASFETPAKPHLRRQIRNLYCLDHDLDRRDDRNLAAADAWIDERYSFLVHPEQQPTLRWLLDAAEVAVIRHGAKVLRIDPWNRLEGARERHESETDYIGRCLRTLTAFAQDFRCHVQVVAHPSKVDAERRKIPPDLYDISGCYSDDTDVLTTRGWLPHAQLTLSDDVACFDPESGEVQYHQPNRIIRKHFVGEMHRFRGYGYDLLVTPDHRMLVRPEWSEPIGDESRRGRPVLFPKDRWSFCNAEDLSGSQFVIPLAGAAIAGNEPGDVQIGDYSYPADAFWRLVGWYVAEGWSTPTGLGWAQAESALARMFTETFAEASISASLAWDQPSGKGKQVVGRWYIGNRFSPELVAWFKAHCGVGAANKRVPEAVFSLSPRLKQVFLDAYIDGDGHRTASGYRAVTVSSRLRDDLQRLAVELGVPTTSFGARPSQEHHLYRYELGFGSPNRRTVSMRTPRNRTLEQYDGLVWCLTVPTGAYFVRRNGKVAVSGNSANWFNMPDQGFVVHRPQIYSGTERKTEAEMIVRKQRFDQLGYPCKLTFHMDLSTNRFEAHNPAEEEAKRRREADDKAERKADEEKAKRTDAAAKREGKRKGKTFDGLITA